MTQRAPQDPTFNKLVRAEITGAPTTARVLFIDTKNQVREAVYESEFTTGELNRVRARLEAEGELKAVVHIAIDALSLHGPFLTLVEYLPDGKYYTHLTPARQSAWVASEGHEDLIKNFHSLFGDGEEET